MPSVYLEDGGRLRCQAVRGYWQIYDGMPATAGVIGRTFRTGEETLVEDVADSGEYLLAVASVNAEVCMPLRVGGAVVGVLNTESPTKLGEHAVAEVRRCAALLSARLEAIGGLASVSPAQRLARIAVRLGSLETAEDIVRETVAAARGLAGFESAMLALPDGDGGFYVHHAEGSFAVALGALEGPELRRIAAWVTEGTSSYTAGDTGGRGFEGHEVLRQAGANAVIVLPLVAAGERHGLLVVADRANHRISTETAELLELLAGQAAGSLRMAAAVTELRERAARDPLTGLGHHATFYAEVPEARAAAAAGRRAVVLLADVDGFKAINDSSGHAAGDDVLRSVAGVLRAVTPSGGRAYRIGGDEFAMLFECGGEADAWAVGWDLQAQARSAIGTTASIGMAIACPGESDEHLVARADAAMYEVKQAGRGGIASYGGDSRHTLARLSLTSKLRRALQRDDFVVHYQPLVVPATGDLVAFEALVRWQDAERGIVGPNEFIPLAEDAGLIEAIGGWVLHAVCAQLRVWRAEGLEAHVHVNVSPRQLRRPDFPTTVREALNAEGLAPGCLTLEITESAAMLDSERANPVVRALHEMGVRLAIDDFGSGHSSLARLRDVPVEVLKIDQSFLRGVPDDPQAAAMTRAIIELGSALGMLTIAEGVTSEAQRLFLIEQGCPLAQGFQFARPLVAEEATERLRALLASRR